jgi:hypothetical protein
MFLDPIAILDLSAAVFIDQRGARALYREHAEHHVDDRRDSADGIVAKNAFCSSISRGGRRRGSIAAGGHRGRTRAFAPFSTTLALSP